MSELSREDAIRLLSDNNTPQRVIEHCLTVSSLAVGIAEKIRAAGHEVDVEFIETAALLHDIGRSRTQEMRHNVEGADILKKYPRYARVAERHIGAGITKAEAAELGLPAKDYLPETLEEGIIAYADNLVDEDRVVSFDETLDRFKRELGPQHPAVGRLKKLHRRITEIGGS